jgi:hypothetical protein
MTPWFSADYSTEWATTDSSPTAAKPQRRLPIIRSRNWREQLSSTCDNL